MTVLSIAKGVRVWTVSGHSSRGGSHGWARLWWRLPLRTGATRRARSASTESSTRGRPASSFRLPGRKTCASSRPRSEERRVGKECRSRRSEYDEKKNNDSRRDEKGGNE